MLLQLEKEVRKRKAKIEGVKNEKLKAAKIRESHDKMRSKLV